MKLIEQPPHRPEDDLDGLLRSFFRAQMPPRWPAPPASPFRRASSTRPTAAPRPLMRSRWALAASIGLLLLGSLLLPGRFTPGNIPDQGPEGTHISDRMFQKNMNREHQKNQHENKPERGIEDGEELPDLE